MYTYICACIKNIYIYRERERYIHILTHTFREIPCGHAGNENSTP